MIEGFLERVYPALSEVVDEYAIALQRKKFFSLIGDIYEDEDFYVERLNAFLEWLLVEADAPTIKRPIIKYLIENRPDVMSDEMKRLAVAMMKSRRSIYLLVKKEKEFAVLEDIFDKERFYVDMDPRIEKTEKRSLVESRVCLLDGRSRVTDTYLRFPDSVKRVVLKRLKRFKEIDLNMRDSFLNYSSALFIRSTRYRNIPIEKIAESLDYLIEND